MANSTTMRLVFLSILCALCVTFYACSEDDTGGVKLSLEDFRVTSITVRDSKNDGNAGDINVQFTGGMASSEISEYRVFYALASRVANVNESAAADLSSAQFLSISNTEDSYDVTLSATQLDFDGDEILEETDYVVFVLSVGTLEGQDVIAISDPSSTFQLIETMEVETVVSSFPANDGLFVTPEGTVLASNFGTPNNTTGIGNGTEVYSVNSDGKVEVFASGLVSPMGGVMDGEGNYYLTSDQNLSTGIIKKISTDGTVSDLATVDGWPSGLTIDGDGNIYAANFISSSISRITPEGIVSVFATDDRLAGCVGIDTDEDGNIVTANFGTGDVLSINSDGEVRLITRIAGVRSGFGVGYMTIFQGDIYATGIGNHRIYKVGLDGATEIFAGSGTAATSDGELLSASFNAPNGIAGDEERKILYISQFGESGLRKIQFK